MFGVSLSAQEIPKNIILNLDIENVMMDSLMTKSQIVASFGEPDDYKLYDYDLDGIYEEYYYGKDRLLFINSRLYSFSISTSRWSVLNRHFTDGIRVGDNISRLASFEPEYHDSNTYTICCYEDFYMVINVRDDGAISNINFSFRN